MDYLNNKWRTPPVLCWVGRWSLIKLPNKLFDIYQCSLIGFWNYCFEPQLYILTIFLYSLGSRHLIFFHPARPHLPNMGPYQPYSYLSTVSVFLICMCLNPSTETYKTYQWPYHQKRVSRSLVHKNRFPTPISKKYGQTIISPIYTMVSDGLNLVGFI